MIKCRYKNTTLIFAYVKTIMNNSSLGRKAYFDNFNRLC